MKDTGIVRRVDELGRVVLPKEMRRTMHIKEGDELEIYVDGDTMLLRKYSQMSSLGDVAGRYASALKAAIGGTVVVTDTMTVVAASGEHMSRYQGQRLSQPFFVALAQKEVTEDAKLLPDDTEAQLLLPVVVNSALLGSLVVIVDSGAISDATKQTAQVVVELLKLALV